MIMPWNGPTAVLRLRRRGAGGRQLGGAQAGRADADGGGADGRGRARGGHPARRLQRRAGHRPGRRRRPRRATRRSTRSRSPARSPPGSAIQAAARRRVKRVSPRARRQEPVHRLPRRRPGDGVGDVDGRRVERLGPGLHVRHPRARARQHLRRLRRAASSRARATCASARASTRRARWARSCRPTSSSASSATSAIGKDEGAELVLGGEQLRRPRLLPPADGLHRRAQRHAHRPGGDLRPGDGRSCRSAPRTRPTPSPTTSSFGLAAGVWTNDLSRAHRATRALRAGTVWVNTYLMGYPSVPYGGVKQSGHGRTLGAGLARRVHPAQERLDEGRLSMDTDSGAPEGPHRRHRRPVSLRVDDRPLRLRPGCARCSPTTSGRSTAMPIPSPAARRSPTGSRR